VNEHIVSAIVGLNKAKTFSALNHLTVPVGIFFSKAYLA
jgi:hypothetical protein